MNLLLTLGCALLTSTSGEDKAELGKVVPDLTFKDLSGKEFKLSDFRKNEKSEGKVVHLVFWSYKCPSGAKIMADLKALSEKCEKEGVVFVGLCAYGESEDQLKKYADQNDVKYPLCFDTDKKGAKLFDAKVVTASFVLDREGKLVYRGAWGKAWAATEATLAGKEVAEKETKAKG